MDMARMGEGRRERRQVMIGDVLYCPVNYGGLENPSKGLVSPSRPEQTFHTEQSYKGMLFDFSPSGLCIFTHRPLSEGMELKLAGTKLWDNSRYAVVKWCKQIAHDIYRVGLSFQATA